MAAKNPDQRRPRGQEAPNHQQGQAVLLQLGHRVRANRLARKMTLRQLASSSGVSSRFLSDLEAGKANISVVKLASIARAVGTGPAELLGDGAAPSPRRKVVSLLGLRGAGKSTVGRLLSEKLSIPFFELDKLIEQEAGMRLSEIFAFHGEDYYRRVELSVLKRFLLEHEDAILATGGSVVTSPEAFRLLSEHTRTVRLKATPEEHWDRVVKQGDLRPIENQPHAMAELRRRLREREPLYSRAELTCSTSGRSVASVVSELARRLDRPAAS
ncbi:MAG TPA: shikimate kinase [Myxococcaceae bacterium]|nr:shikimate kinase [Myxococcaceae bacterium]